MKKILTTALSLCVIFVANAQIELSPDDVYSLGTYQMAYDTSGGFDEGTPGANKTWDFSKLKKHLNSNIRVIPYSDNGLGIDANMVETEDGDTLSFIKKTTTEINIFFETGPSSTDYKSVKLLKFPAKYNDRIIDSANSVNYFSGDDFGMPLIDSIRMTTKIKFDNNLDAWGTIKLAMGNFNALRVKQNLYFNIAVAAKTGKLPYVNIPSFGQIDTSINYTWLTKGKGHYLAQYYPDDNEIEFMVSSGLSSKTISKFKAGVLVSNPINDQMMLKNAGNDAVLLTVFDINGKQLAIERLEGKSESTIETSSFKQGMYTIQILNLTTHSVSFQKVLK